MPNSDADNFNYTQLLNNVKTLGDFETVMSQLYKQGIQHLLESEMSHFLGYDKHQVDGNNTGNSRNGNTKKLLKSENGKIEVQVPRDRNGEFEPMILPKRQSTTEKIEEVITSLYARGMSTQDISNQIKEIYGIEISKGFVSNITNKMIDFIHSWQNRPLEPVYYILWMDGIRIKVRQDGKIINKTIYIVLGLKQNGKKEVLGLWINQQESAAMWLQVLNDLKQRGLEEVLIACTDNLTGFVEAIEATYPDTHCQLCMVHQIRNSTKFVPWKDRKQFVTDLKNVYTAVNKEDAKKQFEQFARQWENKYPYAIKSWQNNWEQLTAYFDYPKEIRKIMYTTNTIESLNRAIRKYTKTKTVFPNDQAAIKSVYLAIEQIERKWTMPIRNWNAILNYFLIIFEDKLNKFIS